MGQASKFIDRARPSRWPADFDPSLIKSRAILPNGEEFLCLARNVTLRSADIRAKARVGMGQAMVLYLEDIGLIHGSVTELLEQGFRLALLVSETRRDRIAAQLEWHAGRATRQTELRGAPRIVPLHRAIDVSLGKTIVYAGMISNISRSGAAIALDADDIPFVGTRVRVGSRFATVVRLIPEGIAVEFTEPFTSDNFDACVRL